MGRRYLDLSLLKPSQSVNLLLTTISTSFSRFLSDYLRFLLYSYQPISPLSEISEKSLSEVLGMFSVLRLAVSGSSRELAGESFLAFLVDER